MNERTVKEYAASERVTERTVYNWMAKGAVDYRRTPGGGIRIAGSRADGGMKSTEKRGKPSS